MPKKTSKSKAAASAAARGNAATAASNNNAAAASGNAVSSSSLAAASAAARGNAATAASNNNAAASTNNAAAVSSISQPQQASESSVSRLLGPVVTTGSLLSVSDQSSAHRNTDESSNRRTTSAAASYRNEGLSPRHATPAVSSAAASSSSSSASNAEMNEATDLSHTPSNVPVKETWIHPHVLTYRSLEGGLRTHDGGYVHCDVCGKQRLDKAFSCLSENCIYDECEDCQSVENVLARKKISPLYVGSVLNTSDRAIQNLIIQKIAVTERHMHGGYGSPQIYPSIFNLVPERLLPNEIKRCNACFGLALKVEVCPDQNCKYILCEICYVIFQTSAIGRAQQKYMMESIRLQQLKQQQDQELAQLEQQVQQRIQQGPQRVLEPRDAEVLQRHGQYAQDLQRQSEDLRRQAEEQRLSVEAMRTSAHQPEMEDLQREALARAQQIREKYEHAARAARGQGGRRKRSTHRKKANRKHKRTHKRSARR